MATTAIYFVKPITEKSAPKHRNKRMVEVRDQVSGVEKAAPRGIENTGLFMGIGEGQGVYICSPENKGNFFYIAPLSGAMPDNPKSAHQPTHLGLVQRPFSKASKRRSHRRQYDLSCTLKNEVLNA